MTAKDTRAPSPALPDRPRIPDPPLPELNPRHVTFSGRVLDQNKRPLAGVLVSDGQAVTRTDGAGTFRLSFDVAGLRFVSVTRPRGHKPLGPWAEPVTRNGRETQYEHDFVFAADPGSDRDAFSFLASGDTQFADLLTFTQLRDEYDELTQMSGQPAFFTLAGDLTMSGTQWEMALYREVSAQSRIVLYNCFGGHDGNYARNQGQDRGSIYHYQRNLGPAWYSWDYGPVHFATYVSEAHFLTAAQQARQTAWLHADLDAQARNTPVVLVTHQPPGPDLLKAWGARWNIIGVIYGHWHVSNVCGTKQTPFIDTTPLRGRDWGAFTRVFRVVQYADGRLTTETRVCGQAQRLDVVAPQGTLSPGSVPVQIKAYDTSRRVTQAQCTVTTAATSAKIALRRSGAWTWEGTWHTEPTAAGDVHVEAVVTAEGGRTWRAEAEATLRGPTPRPDVRLDRDWPGFFREAHSRVVEQPFGDVLELAWVVNTGGRNQKAVSPIIYAGRVYVGVDNKEVGHPGVGVACYEPSNGRRIWHAPTDSSVCFAPTAADGRVYVVSSLGTCYAFEATDGTAIWHSEAFGEPTGHRLVQCCPVVVGEEIMLVADGGMCVMLNRDTGKVQRRLSLGGSQVHFSFPSVAGSRIYAGLRKTAVAHDLDSLEPVWATSIATGKIASTPVPAGGRLFVNATTMTCLDALTGAKMWEQPVPTSGNGIAVAVPAGDLVLANGSTLRAFAADTGALRWEHEFIYSAAGAENNRRQAFAGQSTPLVVGNRVVVGSDDGHVYVLDLTDGRVLSRINLGVPLKGSPITPGNALFVCDWDGNLTCFVAH